MKRLAVLLLTILALISPSYGQIFREGYDNTGDCANLNETVLTPANVNASSFGKLYSLNVGASVYAQILYMPAITTSVGVKNLIYVATMDNVVYAYDADATATTSPVWTADLKPSGAVTPLMSEWSPENFIVGKIGIESTPVIDPVSKILYVVSFTREGTSYIQRLHAINIGTGAEVDTPVIIAATGQGIDPTLNNQRTGLAIAQSQVYVTWASYGDLGNYHGPIRSYSETTLAQTGLFQTTLTGQEGGIWMSGRAPVVDSAGSIYFITGNGDWDGINNFGESFIKFANGSLNLADWFTAYSWASLNSGDIDLGASGPLLIPGKNLVLGFGKDSTLRMLDTTNLGHSSQGDMQIVQELAIPGGGSILSGAAYYNRAAGAGPWLYVWAHNNKLQAFHFNGTTFDPTPVSSSIAVAQTGSQNPALAISANGSTANTGIIWANMPAAPNGGAGGSVDGVLRAFAADDVSNELWNSKANATRDDIGSWSKFRSPLVINGKVFVASNSGNVSVFGALAGGGTGGGGTGGTGATNAATFVKKDTTTQGNWPGTYGADGYDIAAGNSAIPTYASVTLTGNSTYAWQPSTADVRALKQSPTASSGIASIWFNYSTETIDVNLTDSLTHQIALYLLDWDNANRAESISVRDASTNAVLDTESDSLFSSGHYMVWNISGHVKFVITYTGGTNVGASGVFFGVGTTGGGGTGGGGTGGTGTSTPVAGISYQPVAGATSYTISRATSLAGPWTVLSAANAGTTYTDATVVAGTTYYYKIVPNGATSTVTVTFP